MTSATTAPGWTLAITGFASFVVALDAMVTAAALTSMQQSLAAGLADLQWITNAYNLSFAVLLAVGAALGDWLGRRRVLVAGLLIFALASVGCALSDSVTMLIAARALQGVGAALVTPVALALLSVAYPPQRRGRALGIFGSITGLAPLSGPALGGAIAETLHWSWIFWINIPIVLLLVPLALTRLGESRNPGTRLDATSIALVAGFSFAIVWGLMRGTEMGWNAPEVLLALGAALLLIVAFVVRQRAATEPLLPPRLFANQGFAGGLLAAFCLYGALYATLFFITQFEQVAQGFSPLEAGLRILPWTATLFFVAPLAGALVNRLGERTLGFAGLALNALGLVALGLVAAVDLPFLGMAPALIAMGVGVSLAMPAVQSGVMRLTPQADLGKAAGAFSISRFLGGAFGVAATASIFAMAGSFATPEAFTLGFRAVLWSLVGLTALGSAAALALPRRAAVTMAREA